MPTANRCTLEDLKNWMIPLVQQNGASGYKELEVEGMTGKGDNYMSDITFVKVTYEKNGEQLTKNLVIKCAKKSEELRELMPIKQSFENEIYMYTTVLPEFIQFQKKKNLKDKFNNYPKIFGYLVLENTEILAIENIKPDGFELWDRKTPMPLEHIMEVVKAYGKFHAISFALKDQEPELFKKLSNNLTDVFLEFAKLSNNNSKIFDEIINLGKQFHENEVVDKAQILQSQSENLHKLTDPEDPYAVILHGDCWNNNFLFKYDEKENLSKVFLIDWQLSRLASPVYDLSYFLFTCISDEDLKYFDEINETYHQTLTNSLKILGSDAELLFPYNELMNQWKKFSKFGLTMMPGLVRLCLSESEDSPDLAEEAEKHGKDLIQSFVYTVKNKDEYAKRTLGVMKLAASRGFIY